jgi:peptidoglycan hydrolase CwlO-like protein
VADATVISEFILAIAAVVSTATPIIVSRRRASKKQDETVLASFTALNAALGKEVERLQGDLSRMRDDYEKRLTAAQDKIVSLQAKIETLQSVLIKRDAG